ncbi:MAG: hypothetical protein NT002_03985 [candidate division Zixibacteria bacterium]|nr:hypothetical protein [candidate division Zixibacteria bacterium]
MNGEVWDTDEFRQEGVPDGAGKEGRFRQERVPDGSRNLLLRVDDEWRSLGY